MTTMFSPKQKQKIVKQWETFVTTGAVDAGSVRPEILASWRRSRDAGIDPERQIEAFATAEELADIRLRRRALIEIAVPVMRRLNDFIQGSGSVLTLTDEQGVALESLADTESGNPQLTPIPAGYKTSETVVGTNGMGTCLFENRPLQIWAVEHYLRANHAWNCSAAPIHDSAGCVIGCLNLSCISEHVHQHTLGMISAAASAIEEQLKVAEALAVKTRLLDEQAAIFELIGDGMMVIDAHAIITAMNAQARMLLQTGKQEYIGRPIAELILDGADFPKIIRQGKNIYDREASLTLRSGVAHCIMSTAVIEHERGLVITFKENKRMHALVNRVTGSKAVFTFDDILGASHLIQEALRLAKIAANSASTALILGESGTGKELFAQAIHHAGSRRHAPFVVVNCGALPRNLVQSELFGYEGGAFTGAKQQGNPGKFELADGGTIFLDEIGEMPLDAQTSLLRVLQNKEIVRVGGKHPKQIRVRVIAATNKNLEDAVADNSFRLDLFFRLNVLTVHVPSLRERKEDIRLLADNFTRKFAQTLQKTVTGISESAYQCFDVYSWPGNVRELENVIERAVNICKTNRITLDDLPQSLIGHISSQRGMAQADLPDRSLKAQERALIAQTLEATGGNIRETAARLHIARSSLYEKLKKYAIPFQQYRNSDDRNT